MISLIFGLLKNKKFQSFLIKVLPPVLVIFTGFSYGLAIGIGMLNAWVLLLLYIYRANIYVIIANIKYAKGGIQEALKWFRKAHESGKAKPSQSILYGYLLLKNGYVDQAEDVFNQVLKAGVDADNEMLVKSNIALVLWKKGQLDKAVEILESVYENFKNSNLYGSLGYLLILKGDMEKALRFNLEAYEYNSTNSIIMDNLGQTYYLMGDYGQSKQIYEKLMEKRPTFPEAYYNYSLVLLKAGELEKSLEIIKYALNYQLSFLSAVTKEEIDDKIKEIEGLINSKHPQS